MASKKLPTVLIPAGAKVFLLEDTDARIDWFNARLRDITIATHAAEAYKILELNSKFDFYFLEHDLGIDSVGTGADVSRCLAAYGHNGVATVIHSWNPSGVNEMKAILNEATILRFGSFEIIEG